MKSRHRKLPELVIPTSIGHLCGACSVQAASDGRGKMVVSLSRRGDVEPFHAMDMLAEANRLKASGVPVISMAVGQPSDPAPARGSRGGRRGACRTAASATPTRSAWPPCARRSPSITRDHYGLEVAPGRIAVTTGSSAAFNLAFLAMFDPGDRVAIAAPGYPAYRNIMAALGIEVVEIELDGRGLSACRSSGGRASRKAAEGRAVCQPGQPDRRDHSGRRTVGAGRRRRRTRHRRHLRRDLPSAGLCRARHHGARLRRRT